MIVIEQIRLLILDLTTNSTQIVVIETTNKYYKNYKLDKQID